MAQIDSPSAGWYTDPSGLHRARFWDGAVWTEQVRDDVLQPTHATGSATDSVAATVAGVAEAVAAVAVSDVVPTVEPPLVVDYGIDEPGFGSAIIDPFAPVVWPDDTVPPAATAQLLATTEVDTPQGTSPIIGWYPDPTARHQARLWDGHRWTDRVADDGIEGVDPLPGALAVSDPGAASAVGIAPWPSDPSSPGATELSAGQASLASLPDVGESTGTGVKDRPRTTAKVRVAGGVVIAGALALIGGSALTWMEVRGPRVGDEVTTTGLDLGDGRITVVLGAVLLILGVLLVAGRMARFGGAKVAAMGALVAGAAALAVTAVDIADVADRASRLGVPAGAVTDVGTGLWLAFIGSLLAVGGGLLAFANRPER